MAIRNNKTNRSLPIFIKENDRTVLILVIIVVVLLVGLVWRLIFASTSDVFEGMLSNSLSTNGYIKTVHETSGTESIDEKILVQMGTQSKVETNETYTLADDRGMLVTHNIGTPYKDYASYTKIDTSSRNSKGQLVDYSPVLNVWGVNNPGGNNGLTEGEIFNSAVFSVIPIGQVTPTQKASLLAYIKKNHIYSLSSKVAKKNINGRENYVYNVTANADELDKMLQMFGIDIGFNQFNPAKANNLSSSSVTEFQVSVDVLSKQLTSIAYINSSEQDTYSSFGIKVPINLPTKTVPIAKLEKNVQDLSKS